STDGAGPLTPTRHAWRMSAECWPSGVSLLRGLAQVHPLRRPTAHPLRRRTAIQIPAAWPGAKRLLSPGTATSPLVSSVRSGSSSTAPAKKHTAPIRVHKFALLALYTWSVIGLM